MKRKYIFSVIPLILLFSCKGKNSDYINNSGSVFGTYYSITYLQPDGKNLQAKIESRFKEFDLSLSNYNPESIISKINKNEESVRTDSYFEAMFEMAQHVSEMSEGAFDITVAPLVNAWGFGFSKNEIDSEPDVSSILEYVGYKKISLQDSKIIKEDERIMLDASAIAKGQSCDVIALLLEENGCKNYMVEIGGEVNSKGLNPKGEKWRIGIDVPNDRTEIESETELQTIIAISGVSMATSGNYRQFYFRDGKKYAHTIDPRSGYPVIHNLLSATVIAETAMQADVFATAFMVMGLEKSLELCERVDNMECYLIYEDGDGAMKTAHTSGFEQYLTEH